MGRFREERILDTVVRLLSESSWFNIEAGPRQQCVDTNSRHGLSPAKFKVGNVLCFAGREREARKINRGPAGTALPGLGPARHLVEG